MKAAVLKDVQRFEVEDVPIPELEDGSVIVKVKICAICGTDLRTYRKGHLRIQLPHILGHEITGEISAVSQSVDGYHIGERVAITPRVSCGQCGYCLKGKSIYCTNRKSFGFQLPGGYAEYVIIPKRAVDIGVVQRIEDGITFEEASLSEPLSCCLRAQNESQVGFGTTVVVIGGGPLGLLHCRLARARGASLIVLVERDVKRLQQVDITTIDKIIDITKTDPVKEIKLLTEGFKADVVIVSVSSTEAIKLSPFLAAHGGRVNFFGGFPPEQSTIELDINKIHYSEISLQGSHSSLPTDHQEALTILSRDNFKASDLISHTFPLDSIKEALRFAESRKGMHSAISP